MTNEGIEIYGHHIAQGENIIRNGQANYFTDQDNNHDSKLVAVMRHLLPNKLKQNAASGGHLILTDHSLYFVPHHLNLDIKVYQIPLHTISQVELIEDMKISQHIMVTTTEDRYVFVVYKGQSWLEDIQKALQLAK
ncbi:hypothetical protein AWM75_00620 [Aerococcus urinaehominis]|uniref:Uncharacterized protein n=1 Tax=Aerococcus urinaehominis TaxID=128944 RepID=A0A0X8FK56_9LACT|nr:hypothetical protein [Aerococcus urinaehominis]AMB98584.1 hypothetical protein AWM75_00620 [Aerococcus urinaehominis]SDL76898.1 hypothetical protein SAMN04487985_10121 [Aerococcus urinaehominis]